MRMLGGQQARRATVVAVSALAAVALTVGAVVADGNLLDSAGNELDAAAMEDAFSRDAPAGLALAPGSGVRETFYPPFAFRSRDHGADSVITGNGASGCVHSDSALLATEVLLPDGARIESITLYADDTGAGTTSLYLTAWRFDGFPGSGPNFRDIFYAASSGTAGDQVVTDDSPSFAGDDVIDTSERTYALQVSASSADRQFCGAKVTWTPPAGEVLHAITPCTIFDVRPGFGGRDSSIRPREEIRISGQRTTYAPLGGDASDCGIGPDARALQVQVNTFIASSSGGLKLWRDGEAEPNARNGVWRRNQGESFGTVVGLSPDGRFRIKNASAGSVLLQLVVTGFYAPSS